MRTPYKILSFLLLFGLLDLSIRSFYSHNENLAAKTMIVPCAVPHYENEPKTLEEADKRTKLAMRYMRECSLNIQAHREGKIEIINR